MQYLKNSSVVIEPNGTICAFMKKKKSKEAQLMVFQTSYNKRYFVFNFAAGIITYSPSPESRSSPNAIF